ncbi:hypothetical protein [Methanobacterium paludis]|uniref:Uncharacterized protein n=1 Tax=Methanobacterium paludis (strain DSM 25820 / JCM 18151 / SWAN1) TaxID=868131 RepID=F6D5J9_METPW|nr:hypothetical protein [Methanobacterium paludis]AEG17616.1 hypothetical protein MSWAN_0578 [Methanobacterium paludis]
MDSNLENKVKETLENIKPWQRVPTNVRGMFLVKTPSSGRQETVMIEINPVDAQGNPIKRRGIFLKKSSELEGFVDVMQNNKVKDLLKVLEKITGVNTDIEIDPIEI